MVRRIHAATAVAACILSFAAAPAFAGTTLYDFSTAAKGSVATPATIQGATFSSPSDPGAYTFGPNAGLFSALGGSVLSSSGVVATLDIGLPGGAKTITFNYALGDFLGLGGGDTLTVTTNTGVTQTVTASLVGSDFFPEGSFISLGGLGDFTSVAITSAYPIVIADLTAVPEPASIVLVGAGLLGLGAVRRSTSRAADRSAAADRTAG
jgi:hypothetical protein